MLILSQVHVAILVILFLQSCITGCYWSSGVYADIGHMSLQQHQRPSIPILDDIPIEYAKINHSSHTNKKSVPLTAVEAMMNDQLNGNGPGSKINDNGIL